MSTTLRPQDLVAGDILYWEPVEGTTWLNLDGSRSDHCRAMVLDPKARAYGKRHIAIKGTDGRVTLIAPELLKGAVKE